VIFQITSRLNRGYDKRNLVKMSNIPSLISSYQIKHIYLSNNTVHLFSLLSLCAAPVATTGGTPAKHWLLCASAVPILRRFCPKTLTRVGWVEERNPTFGWLCWVSQSLNPTYDFLFSPSAPLRFDS
jgi:hypothetical protein